MPDVVKRFPATPRGTFPTLATAPAAVAPQRTLRDALKTYGPYSPGVMAERANESPQRQAEWAMTQALPANLRDVLQGHMLRNPKSSGQVRDAIDAYNLSRRAASASPQERAALGAAAGALESRGAAMSGGEGSAPPRDALLAAGMKQVTSSAHGVKGATMGMVNGRPVLIPASGAANRAAYMSDMADLGQNPADVGNVGNVDARRYQQEAQRQTAVKGAEQRKQKMAMDLQTLENKGALDVANATAEGRMRVTEAKAKQQRAKEENALKNELGRARGVAKNRYQSQINAVQHEVNVDFQRDNRDKDIGGTDWKIAVKQRLQQRGIPLSVDEYVTQQMKSRYEGSLGTTPDSEWKMGVAREMFPSAFPMPTPQPDAPPAQPLTPAQPMQASAPPPQPTPPPSPMPTPQTSGSPMPAPSPMDQQQAAATPTQPPQASPPPAAFAAHNEDPPLSPDEVRGIQTSADAMAAAAAMEDVAKKLPPELAVHFAQSALLAKQRASQLQRAGL